ncbi:MAG TPA: serine/threonine-protein kinase, partial [Pirellulaceae bacterium]|nr:serine/threonine-protein kinase [Pirellulaceae bacterium]
EHLSDVQLDGLIEDRLSVDEADWVERHLETCERCLQRLSTLNDAALRALDPRARDDGERHPDYDSRLERRITRAIDAGTVEPPVDEAEVTTKLKFARFVDRGGLGQVFEYTDCEFQRPVAIKLLRAELADRPSAVARFRREMEIAATIDTPGCPAVYGSGRTPDGHLFYWMQLVTGPTLTQEIAAFHASPSSDLNRSSTSFRRLLGLFRGICATLAIAHERGILHRDLKPDNVRVHRDGHPIVLDWGLAKVQMRQDEAPAEEFQVESLLSHSGMTIGTPEYMAPEQAAGDVARISHRADIYGLGGILHEILTGDPPHEELRRNQTTVANLLDAVARGHLPALPAV